MSTVTSPVNASVNHQAAGAGGAGAAATASYASASLYVGDLAADVTEALLFEIFNAVGPVASVRVCRDAATRRSLGYAYVNFHRVDDAERALDTLNFKNIRSRPCRIMWSHRDPSLRRSGLGNIFVNGLAKPIDNKQLFDTFSVFGNILSCKVATNSKRESLGYAFVHFESDEAAANAIAKVDGKVIAGEKVTVQAFKSKKERTGGQSKSTFSNVFIKNLPAETTKEQLDGLFSKYGTITSSVVSPVKVDDASKAAAFGFVNFAASEEATAAVDALNNFDFNGKKLFVGRAQKKEEREKELRDRFEQLKVERQKKYAGVNLYVKNLSDDVDDEKLNQEFAKFGPITSAKIMRDADKTKGFGFVCFVNPEDATKAVTEMNGKILSGKPLYVALAQRKEIRRAHLEQQYASRKLGGAPTMPGMHPAAHMGGMPHQQGFPGQPGALRGQPGPYGMYGGQPMMAGYPGQPMLHQPRRFPGAPQPQLINVRPQGPAGMPVNYQLMPLNGRGQPQMMNGQPPNAMMANGQPGRPAPRNGPHPQQQHRVGAPANAQAARQQPNNINNQNKPQGFKYADNVRNQQQPSASSPASNGVVGSAAMADPSQVAIGGNEPLTIKALAAAPEEMKKQMIGEQLFPRIKAVEPALAGKITGMLLEMDNGELLHLLESPAALHEKISEALQVLHSHGVNDQADGDQE